MPPILRSASLALCLLALPALAEARPARHHNSHSQAWRHHLGRHHAGHHALRRRYVLHRHRYLRTEHGNNRIGGLPGPLAAIIGRIGRACPGFHVISGYRRGARGAGSGRQSLHAIGRAADISGGSYRCAYGVLAGFPGGVSKDGPSMGHIHVSYDPGGREWGMRFAHGGSRHRYARRHRQYWAPRPVAIDQPWIWRPTSCAVSRLRLRLEWFASVSP